MVLTRNECIRYYTNNSFGEIINNDQDHNKKRT